jgi:hypothetical protein
MTARTFPKNFIVVVLVGVKIVYFEGLMKVKFKGNGSRGSFDFGRELRRSGAADSRG